MKNRALGSIAVLLSIAALPASAAPQLTLVQAIADAVSSAGMAAPSASFHGNALPTFALTTSVSVEPEEGQRGAVTESEELTFDLRPLATRAAFDASRARFGASAASVRASRRALVADVISAFFAVAKDQADLDAAREASDIAQRSLSAATRRHNAGIAPAVDVERAAIAADQARADLNAASAALAGDRTALAQLTNASTDDAQVTLPQIAGPLPSADAIARAALATNPGVASAVAAVAASRAEAMLARADLQPALSLGAGVGRSVVHDSQATGPAATVSLGIPFFGGAARANVASTAAAATAAEVQLRQAQADAVQSALRALTDTQRETSRIDELQDAFSRASRVAEAELKGYTIGAVSSVDVINAQTQEASARIALAQARVAVAQADALVQLNMGVFDR